jgi:hypothetical protein
MKRKLVGAAVLPLLLACGCESLNHTENGALIGGGGGALLGTLIGGATGHAGVGAAIGAGAGALTGAAIGHAEDNHEKRVANQAAQARAMALNDVVQMTHDHISDAVIISQIRSSSTVFYLSGAEINWLKQNGVSDAVIVEMQQTAYRYPRRVYREAPVYAEPVYVYEPPPPVGFGVVYHGRWR